MNTVTQKTMFSSKNGRWETPRTTFFARLNTTYHFTTDVGASKENALCIDYLGLDNGRDALTSEWGPINYCNPPYGRGIGAWINKAIEESEKGKVVVMLLPARMGSRWFLPIYKKAVELCFVIGRIQFLIDGKPILDRKGHPTSAPFDSVIVIFDGHDKSFGWHPHPAVSTMLANERGRVAIEEYRSKRQ